VSTAKRQNTVSFITNLQAGSLSTAIWKLSFTPTVLSRGVISLKLVPEVSALDFANAVTISGTTIPALTTRRAPTTVELRDGQSFAIAGLLQDYSARAQDQLPWLGSVPVLGALFRSAAYQANENELVVLSDQACSAQQKAEDAFGQLACGERPQLFPERPAGNQKRRRSRSIHSGGAKPVWRYRARRSHPRSRACCGGRSCSRACSSCGRFRARACSRHRARTPSRSTRRWRSPL
jgi:Bacterial type II and III secretion system protein